LIDLLAISDDVIIGGLSLARRDKDLIEVKIKVPKVGKKATYEAQGYLPNFAFQKFRKAPRKWLRLNKFTLDVGRPQAGESLYGVNVKFFTKLP
jgi:hypothetical protein